ncbi:hypothetical protein MKX01_037347 [Papaver californicum]|nr:hypothetical protein MKX01_037347 [Papaver californicum]
MEAWESPITATLPQIGSRLFTRTHVLVSSLVIKLVDYLDYPILFLRYKRGTWFCTFMVVVAQGYEKYCIRMPNQFNFSFDYFYASIIVLGIYVPGGIICYCVEPPSCERRCL